MTAVANVKTHAVTNTQPKPSITEIIQHSEEITALLIPMLSQLSVSTSTGWLTLIDPPSAITRASLTTAGADLSHILILRSSAEFSALELMQQSLSSGCAANVVLWSATLTEQQLNTIRSIATRAQTRGIVIR